MGRFIGWFLLLVGVAIAGLWAVLLSTGQVVEIQQGRLDILFHLAAEFATAALLVVAGLATLRRTRRSPLLAGIALGALGYTAVNSAGYYADASDWATVGMFAVISALTVTAAAALLRAPGRLGSSTDRGAGGDAVAPPSSARHR
jgi:peptidoglycan/LPS O-acetylase OafA/YrhL